MQMFKFKKIFSGSEFISFIVIAGLSLLFSLYLGTMLSPISQVFAQQPSSNQVVRIGYQKYGTVNLLKTKGVLDSRLQEQGVSVEWNLFPAGPQLLEALNAGAIDFGHTGEAPPIFAQAAGADLVYVGNERPNPKGEGILVLNDSPVQTINDLKGKTIVLNKGSNVHYFLVKALESAGLQYSDVKIVFLPPGDARIAFEAGNADAWAIWDPFFTNAKVALNARILLNGEGLVSNREFYLAARPFLDENPQVIKVILEELDKLGKWAQDHPRDVAEILSPELSIDVPILEEISRRRPYGVETPLKPTTVTEQQSIADVFLNLGLIPKPLNVEEAVLQNPL
jgi:sulfonate transport system substrate-binding protein